MEVKVAQNCFRNWVRDFRWLAVYQGYRRGNKGLQFPRARRWEQQQYIIVHWSAFGQGVWEMASQCDWAFTKREASAHPHSRLPLMTRGKSKRISYKPGRPVCLGPSAFIPIKGLGWVQSLLGLPDTFTLYTCTYLRHRLVLSNSVYKILLSVSRLVGCTECRS